MIMSESDKELAIRLAKRLGEEINFNELGLYSEEIAIDGEWTLIDDYLSDKAWEILKSEGMAGKIDSWLSKKGFDNISIRTWWIGLTPRKIIEVYLEMEDE